MKIINKIDNDFLSLFGYQIKEKNRKYVDSKYVLEHTYKDKKLFFNVLTSEFVCCDKDELLDDNFKFQHWFKLPEDIEQYSFASTYKQSKINKLFYTPEGKIKKVVIFTTTDCNARCYYCFENGVAKIRMEDKTAEDVADFLISHGQEYYISWFGGEPLYNSRCIDIITDKLRCNNINFKSDITTNGYLLNEHSIYKLRYKWNVASVQITLDGTQDIYNKTKDYIYDDPNPFNRVLNNVFYLSENDIFVKIRYNLSTFNVPDVKQLITDIYESGRINKNIHMYSSRLNREFDFNIEDEQILCDSEHYINRYISELIGNPYTKEMFMEYSTNYCLADSGNAYVINPVGQIGRCEHYSDKNQLYSIYNPTVNVKDVEVFTHHRRTDKCSQCILYPNCTLADVCENLLPCDEIGNEFFIDSCKLAMENSYENKVDLKNYLELC